MTIPQISPVAAPAAQLPDFVVCPRCSGSLAGGGSPSWRCTVCGQAYPVRDGVPRFLVDLDGAERRTQRVFDFEHARYQDSQRCHFGPALVHQFLSDVKLPAGYFAGKRVLDAGCGSGRWSYALAALGAKVVAVDLTGSGVRATAQVLAPYPDCHVYQASVEALPFRPALFDVVISWGVMHHTPDTRRAFLRLAPAVKPGGVLYVMVYERLARYRTAPTDALRWCLRHVSDERRYRFCRLLVIRNPHLYLLLWRWLKVYHLAPDAEDARTLQFDAYDAYSPRFNHLHSKDEVIEWFLEAGFEQVALTHPVRYRDPRLAGLYGECGGAVHVRGVRPDGDATPLVPLVEPVPAEDAAMMEAGVAPPALGRIRRLPLTQVALQAPAGWWVRARLSAVHLQPPTYSWDHRLTLRRHDRAPGDLNTFADRVLTGLPVPDADHVLVDERPWANQYLSGLLREYSVRRQGHDIHSRTIYFVAGGRNYQLTCAPANESGRARARMVATFDVVAATIAPAGTGAAGVAMAALSGRAISRVARLTRAIGRLRTR